MAKLKAPLLSLGASGAVGKSLVFFGWKGIDVVREYVIPANPKSDAQLLQRGYLTEAVAAIHAAEADVNLPLLEDDRTAYSLYGSTFPTPRTWFNQICQRWLLAKVKGEHPQILGTGVWTHEAAGEITIRLFNYQYVTEPGKFYCGTSKTALIKTADADGVDGYHYGEFTGLTPGVKYFFQFRPTKVADAKYVARSGIYHRTCT